MDTPVSEELRSLLRRQRKRGATAPTVKPHIMAWANDLLDREESREDHSPSDDKGSRPKLKAGRVQIIRSRPFLAVIIGGKSAH